MRVEAFRSEKDELKVRKYFKKHKDHRRYPLLIIGLNTGLRVGDIVKLKVNDFNGDYLYLSEGKTTKKKRIAINTEIKQVIKEYYFDSNIDDYLFPSREGGHISECQVWRWFKEAKKKCRIRYNIGTHTMRKSLGKKVNKKHGTDVAQMILGHDNQRDTLQYLGIEQDMLDKVMLDINS